MQSLRQIFHIAALAALAGINLWSSSMAAEPQAFNLANKPLYYGTTLPPMVMLDMTKDHTLMLPLFNDYTDLNGDGVMDTGYNDAIDYYGYFDAKKCYVYDSANSRYVPDSIIAAANHQCNAGVTNQWSGNFMNWATMTRMDAVRKIFFGGLRSQDPTAKYVSASHATTATVLERAHLTHDSHAFAKFYAGSDINKYTPFAGLNGTAPGFSVPATSTVKTVRAAQTGGGGWTEYQVTGVPAAFYTYAQLGDQMSLAVAATPAKKMLGRITGMNSGAGTVNFFAFNGSVAGGWFTPTAANGATVQAAGTAMTIVNETDYGITFCNVSDSNNDANSSEINTGAPVVKAARGNYSAWDAQEHNECNWQGIDTGGGYHQSSSTQNANVNSIANFPSGTTGTNNGNEAFFSGLQAGGNAPLASIKALPYSDPGTGSQNNINQRAFNANYVQRVEACVRDDSASINLIGGENCELYGNGAWKPIGLLQQYGEKNTIYFGLLSGSYTNNISGGALRKNVGTITDEVDMGSAITPGSASPTSTGAFVFKDATNNWKPTIIGSMSRFRDPYYGYNNGYNNDSGGGNSANTTKIVLSGAANSEVNEGTQGNAWGNPIGEMYLETLRYFAGKSANANFAATNDAAVLPALGIWPPLLSATWADPIKAATDQTANYCAPLNTIVVSSATPSYDNDQWTSAGIGPLWSDVSVSTNPATGVSNPTITSLTDYIGSSELSSTNTYFVGNNGTINNNLCTAKSVPNLSSANGVCPEQPSTNGSYLIAGAAWQSHVASIRTDRSGSQTMNTYAVQLSTSTPKINLYVGGKLVQIIPQAIRNENAAYTAVPSTIVKFKVISQNATSGKFLVVYDRALAAADYDQDVYGVLSYQISGSTVSVSTEITGQSSGANLGFGYVISGTTADGPHFHSGINGGFTFADPANITVKNSLGVTMNGGGEINASGGCANCTVATDTTTVAYTVSAGASTQLSLNDPLYYAAKWGGFKVGGGAAGATPATTAQWDVKLQTGAPGSDGVPDNYFYVINPNHLGDAISKALIAILSNSSAASVATNSAQFSVNTAIYQARFNGNEWTGQLLKFETDNASGAVSATPDWDSGVVLGTQAWNSPASGGTARQLITARRPGASDALAASVGIPFQWPAVPASPTASEMFAWQSSALGKNEAGVTDGKGNVRLNWLRGNQSDEGTSSTSMRQRDISLLGDLANSYPLYIGAPDSGTTLAGYHDFKALYASRNPVIAVGGNDGIFHVFSSVDGSELLGFLPSSTFGRLSQPMRQDYQGNHLYLVDGSPVSDDVVFPSDGKWHTLVTSGLGAGGKEVFALNVTNTSGATNTNNDPALTEANAASILKWEFASSNRGGGSVSAAGDPTGVVTGDADLGYTFSKPLIAYGNNSKHVVIFGNGYNNTTNDPSLPNDGYSTTGIAALYVVDAETGYLIKKIPLPAGAPGTGAGTATVPNGLSTVRGLDADLNGTTDYVYAGDLYGNIWKFDLTSTDPTHWKSALYSGSTAIPLFTVDGVGGVANNRRPITGELRVVLAPQGGYMVVFGTGRYIASGTVDLNAPYSSSSEDDLYSVWDDGTRAIGTGRNGLLPQTFQNSATVSGVTYRNLSSNVGPGFCAAGVTPTGGNANTFTAPSNCVMGCFASLKDYPSTGYFGERFTFFPEVSRGTATFNTIIPSSDRCAGGGNSEVIDFNVLTCGALPSSPFDVNNDGVFSAADNIVFSGTTATPPSSKLMSGITPPGTRIYNFGSGETYIYNSSSLGNDPTLDKTKITGAGGRVSWRPVSKNPLQ